VHPAVRRRRAELMQLASNRGVDIVVNDIPLLFEVLQPNEFDCIVLIDAPANVRLDRMVEQRGLSRAEASRMIDAQMPSELKRRSSDYVIQNDKDLESLRVRTSEVWQLIRERAQPA
ncbi:MAG: dephospho-CoA kinase, partial [Gemmatimonadales bacterium]